jgi:tetratricopeptide (TPR) repeat protein
MALNLPASAIQVFENMWGYKQSISGFDLAFEEPLTEYLLLLDTLRRDDRLAGRLTDYAGLYQPRGRYLDRFLFVRTRHESRTMAPEEFLERARLLPVTVNSLYDARRLRLMAVVAQEQGDEALAEKIFEAALAWPPLEQELGVLMREARLFQADRFYEIGNYYAAEKRYQQILADDRFDSSDRDWAYLQSARLHELKGELKTSMRIYGQIAYAPDENSLPLATFSKQRMMSIAADKTLSEAEKEVGLGAY